MKKTQYSTMSLSFFVSEPEDPAEFDRLAGSVGACINEANSNVCYRSTFPKIRAALIAALVALTGEPMKSKPKVNSKGEPVMITVDGKQVQDTVPQETEKAYYNRLLAGNYEQVERAPLTVEEAKQALADLERSKPELFILDPSVSERSKKVPKEIEAAVDNILNAIEGGNSSFERVFGNIAAQLGVEAASLGDHSRENLCAAMVQLADKQARERANSLL